MSFYTEFAEHYESIFPFSEDVYAFLRKHFPAPPARVLDIGCGTGHYARRLAADGYETVGIDLDPAMIANAQAHYPQAEFRVLDMTEIRCLDGRFDAIACIGNTAAHLMQAQFADLVADVAALLRPRGIWILQLMNWDYVLTQDTITFPVIKGEDNAVFYRAYRDISETQVTFATRLEVAGTDVFEDEVPLYPIRTTEIVALHTEYGFVLVTHAGSYSGAPFDPTTFSADLYVCERA